jgi:hypothetical protein
VTARGRHRSRPNPAPKASTGSGQRSHCDQEPLRSIVPRTREPLVTPQESRPGGQRPAATSQTAGQETPPESVIDLLWRVRENEKAQDWLCRVIKTVAVYILWPFAALVYLTAPGSSPLKAIFAGGSVTVIATVTSVTRWLRKRRASPLAAVWRTTDAGRLITAAQEADSRLCDKDGGHREDGSHAQPDQDAPTARHRRRGPRPCRGRHNSGFDPVGDQRYPLPTALCSMGVGTGIWRGQGSSGRLVSAHSYSPRPPARHAHRRNSVRTSLMFGADLS